MDFGWAIIQLKNGEKVKRASWNNNDCCLYIERAIIHQLNCSTGKVYCTSLDLSDFDANDWELFKEFNLSGHQIGTCFSITEVKQFIKILKDKLSELDEGSYGDFDKIIDKLAGDNLI